MASIVKLSVQVTLANAKALRALKVACECMELIGDDMPWRPEAKRAAKALRYAAKHLKLKTKRR